MEKEDLVNFLLKVGINGLIVCILIIIVAIIINIHNTH